MKKRRNQPNVDEPGAVVGVGVENPELRQTNLKQTGAASAPAAPDSKAELTQRRRDAKAQRSKPGIPVRYDLEIGLPRRRSGIDGAYMRLSGALPFAPHGGMYLVAVDGDDFRKVDQVYWSEAEGLTVMFEFDEQPNVKWLKELGWEEVK